MGPEVRLDRPKLVDTVGMQINHMYFENNSVAVRDFRRKAGRYRQVAQQNTNSHKVHIMIFDVSSVDVNLDRACSLVIILTPRCPSLFSYPYSFSLSLPFFTTAGSSHCHLPFPLSPFLTTHPVLSKPANHKNHPPYLRVDEDHDPFLHAPGSGHEICDSEFVGFNLDFAQANFIK